MNTGAVASTAALSKQFPGASRAALSEVNLEIRAGVVTGLVGPDGAGKTTLLRILAGLLLPTAGTVRVLGQDPGRDIETLRSSLGYMPQKFGLYEDLTVQENLALYAELKGLRGKARAETFERLLTFTDLARFTKRLAGQLSGGMKQKLGLACTLLGTPKILLLDEPGVGVDPVSRRELWQMVRELITEGNAVVWSTAYLDEAEACDHVVLLSEGNVLFTGPPADLHARVRGRVFLLDSDAESPRATLRKARRDPASLDGVVQGKSVRLIARNGATLAPQRYGVSEAASLQPTAPRFEDGFIDLLGGVSSSESALAQALTPRPRDGSVVIETRALTKRFGDFVAADSISLKVERGEVFGLLGPNGAGKSTTFKMLCGLLAPSSGQAEVAGVDLRKGRARARQRLGYMAQKFSLYGHLSIKQNLEFFAGAYALTGAAKKEAIDRLVTVFEFDRYLDAKAGELPLGLKQRLALAAAVLHGPEILFLDEPTSGVDPLTRREFWTHINGIVERGVTVLVTTHFMDEAEYCDRIALISQGKTLAIGTPDDLKVRAATPELPHPTMEEAFIGLVGEGVVMLLTLRRVAALVKKELLQILRDPSTLIIATLFPVLLMLIFGSGISLDSTVVRLGVFDQDGSPPARRLVETYRHTPGFRVVEGTSVDELSELLRAGKLQGFVVLDQGLGRQMLTSSRTRPVVQIITDGAEPNGANFVAAYAQGAFAVWSEQELARRGYGARSPAGGFSLETRAWFNPSTKSRNSLLPGSVTLVMMVVGALLTALVVAREWERGTMEALLTAGVTRFELLVSKLIPYFLLGQVAFTICVAMAHLYFEVPLRGSIGTLYLVGSTFLGGALGMGLLISTLMRNQYNAAQVTLNAAFLPGLMLSGFLFEIRSMPVPIQVVSSIIPARYFVTAMQTVFQAGDVWSVLTRSLVGLALAAVGFVGLTFLVTKRRLE